MSLLHRRKRPDRSAAALAKMRAQDDLKKTTARWPEVIRVSASLRELAEQNHFAASIRTIFQGGQRS